MMLRQDTLEGGDPTLIEVEVLGMRRGRVWVYHDGGSALAGVSLVGGVSP